MEISKLICDDLRKKTDEGILGRKKRLGNEVSHKPRITIKKLVEKLSEQAKLDEQLRNNKLCFESNSDVSKWEKLQEELSKKGVRMDKEKMRSVFKVTDEENNPFFTVRETNGTV